MARLPTQTDYQRGRTAVGDPLERLFALAPDRYAYCLIRCLADAGSVRFTVLQNRFSMSSRTLTARLKQLLKLGVVERRAFRALPPRVEYRLTASGRRLAKLLDQLAQWSKANCPR